MKMKYNTLEEFITHQKQLIDLEHKTEVEEQKQLYESKSIKHLENKGICIRHMHVDHHKTGLYGRFLVTFSHSRDKFKDGGKERGDEGNSTHSHKLTSGDIVGVYPNKGENDEELSSGVVSYVRGATITIAFSEDFDVSAYPMFRLMLLTNEVTYRRLKRALETLRKISNDAPCSGIIDELFPCQQIESSPYSGMTKNIEFFNDVLDNSQKDAVKFVLQSKQKISVIHGPPGTGKTTTVVEVVRQAVKHCSLKVLACAPSNIAVDNLVQKLSKGGLKVVRLGHPARVSTELQKYSLDAILTSRDSGDIIKSVRADISSNIGKFKKCKNKSEIISLRNEVKGLRKELVTREAKAMSEVLANADVILSTANSAAGEGPLKHLPDKHFDMLIIDEAAQALEISCWIPVLQSPRLILVGDHKQLPPTIISHEAAKKGLEITLLERVVNGLGENVVSMLTTQYRMHEAIMCWPSRELYENKLVAADSVAKHLLCDLDGVEKTGDTCVPLVFVDTSGFNMHESVVEEDESKGNQWEVEIVKDHIDALVESGLHTQHIGVITPYNLQVKMLRKCICSEYPGIEIHSVDGFQGREKEAILISMVRSNEKGEIGFLSEDRRMNVALTRARRHLFVVGDSQTVSHHPFLQSMCKYLEEEGDLRTPRNTDSGAVVTVTASSETFKIPDADNILLNKDTRKRDYGTQRYDNSNNCKYTSSDDTSKQYFEDRSLVREIHSTSGNCKGEIKNITNSRPVAKVVQTDLILNQIEDFSKSCEAELVFPCSLTAKERAFVHEMSEQFGLKHVSCGDGGSRRIVVSKMDTPCETGSVAASKANQPPKESKIGGHVICEMCSVNVPITNYQLHLIRCKKIKEAEVIRNTDKDERKNVTKTTKANKNKKKEGEDKEEEDIDALLDSFAKQVSKCNFPKCKNPVKTLGQKCYFCSQMFCLTHHMAEIHGCGDAAKIRARQDIAKFKGNVPQKMNDIKKAQVQNKLNSKLSKLEEQRKKKAKES